MVPGRTLNRRSLTLLIGLSILVPVSFGLGLFAWVKPIPEPSLKAQVRLERIWIEPRSPAEIRRWVPAITVKNQSTEAWKNLTIGLNKSIGLNQSIRLSNQFYANEPAGIEAGGSVTVPLEAFVARNGSVHFPVAHRAVEYVTVFAQIGTGARGVSEFKVPANSSQDSASVKVFEETAWISPTEPEAP